MTTLDTADTTALPWYRKDLGPRLKPETRKLLETYSGVPNTKVEAHLYTIRDRAWNIKTYPCVGQWQWLTSITPVLPIYPAILKRIKAGDAILDLGCCLGQDLRILAADGAPTDQMFASDIESEFWNLSCDLYRDKEKMQAEFTEADIFAPEALKLLEGRIDVILASHFLHLWNWDKQIEAAKKMILLTKPGAWIVGCQIGSYWGKEVPFNIGGKESGITMFLHNVETTKRFWKQVGNEVGIEISADGSECPLTDWLEPEDCVWMEPTGVGLSFLARRLDGSGNQPLP